MTDVRLASESSAPIVNKDILIDRILDLQKKDKYGK